MVRGREGGGVKPMLKKMKLFNYHTIEGMYSFVESGRQREGGKHNVPPKSSRPTKETISIIFLLLDFQSAF